jgi:hypothetical protein
MTRLARCECTSRPARPRPSRPGCDGPVWVKDQRPVELDLAAFGRPARLVRNKRRWACPSTGCSVGSFVETASWIAAPRLVMTDRAGGSVGG